MVPERAYFRAPDALKPLGGSAASILMDFETPKHVSIWWEGRLVEKLASPLRAWIVLHRAGGAWVLIAHPHTKLLLRMCFEDTSSILLSPKQKHEILEMTNNKKSNRFGKNALGRDAQHK